MAVPEALGHPFATAKIVVWPGTCSVRGGRTIAARSRDARSDATLCAYGRRGERTSDRGHRDEGSKCLLHSRGLLQDGAFGQRRWTVNPSGGIVSGQRSELIEAGFEPLAASPDVRCDVASGRGVR